MLLALRAAHGKGVLCRGGIVGEPARGESIITATQQLRGAAMIQAILGIVLLLLAASALEWYFDVGQHRLRAAYVAVGCLLCGATSLASAWFVYRRRLYATVLYAASWSLNILGWTTASGRRSA